MSARTPDSADGPLYEEAVVWEEQSSDPTDDLREQYVQDKGLVILEDGVVHGLGEARENLFQPPVDNQDVDTPPPAPETGERVIVGGSPTGAFVGHEGEIAQWDGSAWVFTVPKEGTFAYVKDEVTYYKQENSGSPWSWSDAAGTGVTETVHKTLRQLIHLAERGGPWDGFSMAPYREPKTGSGPWDHGYMWWKSSGKTNAERIIEKTINRNANKTPSTIAWTAYDGSGNPLVTATDTFAYTGGSVKHNSITRAFS